MSTVYIAGYISVYKKDSMMFGWLNYLIFVLCLCIPLLIGVYFGFIKKKDNSTKEYLYGIGKMTAIPVGLSLYSSCTSAVMILGFPSEIYVFGGQYLFAPIGLLLSLFITWYIILPVFCGTLKITSPYEYIELRFNYTVRLISTCIYVLHTLLFMPLALYASTLTFSEASGIPLLTCITVVGGLCVFYTTVGGFSSVIWTDTLQAALMFGACIVVLCKGIYEVGSIGTVWQRAQEGGRLNVYNFDINPFIRLSTFSLVAGKTVFQVAHGGCTASAIQRYMALDGEKPARIGALISVIGASITMFLSCSIGLCMYAYFYTCDPVASETISSYNKMVPYYVAHIVNDIPGFFGLFTAGLLSAGLSTISAEMNTVGGLIYHDIIRSIYKKPISSARETFIIKIIVFLTGLLYVIAAPLVQKAKYIAQIAVTLSGITYGIKVGTLILGTAFPKCNVKGVICGILAGLIIVSWISIGAMQYDLYSGYQLPMSTDSCMPLYNSTDLYNTTAYISNITTSSTTLQPSFVSAPFILYKLSYMYYPVLGLITMLTVAIFVSYLTGFNDVNKMDPRLMISYVRPVSTNDCCLPNKQV